MAPKLVNNLLDYTRADDPGDGFALLDEAFIDNAWNRVECNDAQKIVSMMVSVDV